MVRLGLDPQTTASTHRKTFRVLFNLVMDDPGATLILLNDSSFDNYMQKGYASGNFVDGSANFKSMIRDFYFVVIKLQDTLTDQVKMCTKGIPGTSLKNKLILEALVMMVPDRGQHIEDDIMRKWSNDFMHDTELALSGQNEPDIRLLAAKLTAAFGTINDQIIDKCL